MFYLLVMVEKFGSVLSRTVGTSRIYDPVPSSRYVVIIMSYNFPCLLLHVGKVRLLRTSGKFGQRPCLFHIIIIGIKNKLTKQTVEIQVRRLMQIHLDFHCFQMYVQKLPDVRSYLTLPYHNYMYQLRDQY